MQSGVNSSGFFEGEVDGNLFRMIRVLRSQKRGLHVCHINSQSLNPKLDEFRLLFTNSKVDVICISETWFSSDTDDCVYSVAGYQLFRADRIGRAGGGVAIYARSGINCKIVSKSNAHSTSDYLFVKISCGLECVLLGVIYRPNKTTDISPVIKILEGISCSTSEVIVCGDLNCNLLNTRTSAQLVESFESIDLKPVNLSTPTHFSHESSTLLDVYFISDVEKALLYSQLPAACFSKHDLIYLTYDLRIDEEQTIITYRDFKNLNYFNLRSDIANVQWEEMYCMPSANQQVAFLHHHLNTLFNQHVPLKNKVLQNRSPPWFNRSILEMIEKRNSAYIRWKRYRLAAHHSIYRSLRNLVVRSIKTAKRRYYENSLNPTNQSGKNLWDKLRKLGNGKQRARAPADVDCNLLVQFVSTPSIRSTNGEFLTFDHNVNEVNGQHFYFTRLTDEDVVEAVLSIKSNAIGLDEINPKFLKLLLPYILPYITHIFNCILTTCEYPRLWKQAKVIPIPKSQSRARPEYRPISILPFLSKVFEKAVIKQMHAYLTRNNLLSSAQSGFRAKRSCKTALLLVVDDIRKALDLNSLTFLTLLDFSKAFDTVDHSILCEKLLNNFGFSSLATKLLHSYLSGRQQCVVVGSQMSSFLEVFTGVPQGSILGPLLFSLYVNELPRLVKHCSVHMYADDVQLFLSCPLPSVASAVCDVNEDLNNIQQWALKNSLSLNPEKSKTLCIYKKVLDTSRFPLIKLGHSVIEYVHTARNLGLIFNETLTWTDHLTATIGKVYGGLRLLWSAQNFVPIKTKMLLVKTLLLPILLYGCEVFCKVDFNTNRKLNVIYNNFARYIFNIRYYDHISIYSKQIMGLSFGSLLQFRSLILLHEIMQSRQPEYLYNKLSFANSQRSVTLILPRFNCLVSERSFFVHVTLLWNSLPATLRRIENTNKFKTHLYKHLANDV